MTTEFHGNIGIRQETAFGAEATPPEAFEEIMYETMMLRCEMIKPDAANGLRVSRYAVPGRISAGGDIDTVLSPEGALPWMLKGALGKVESSEVEPGVYEHVFSPLHANRLPSFTIQTNMEDKSESWMGCAFSGMSLSAAPDRLATVSFSLLSQRPGECAPQQAADFSDAGVFQPDCFEFSLNGFDNLEFQDFSLSIDNNLEAVHSLNGKRYCGKHHVGRLDISGSITLEFRTEAERRRLWGALNAAGPQNIVAPGTLTAIATHNNEAAPGAPFMFAIYIPELYYESAPANISREGDRVTQRIDFKPSWHAASNQIITMTIRNRTESYPDPA